MSASPENFDLFKRFARERLQASAFHADGEKDSEYLFHASLNSTDALMAWAAGATNRCGETFEVIPGFVDIYRPNAFADRFESKYFLGMYSAMFVAVAEFAMYCMTQSDFMSGIGRAELETSPSPEDSHAPGLWLINRTKMGGRVHERHSQKLTPRCDIRYQTSIYLCLLMARFAWLHEMAHAFNGHVAYTSANGMSSRINEVAEPHALVEYDLGQDKEDEKARVMRCLEFDADQSAFWASINIQIRDLENIEGIRAIDQTTRLSLALFGAYAMTWLFGEFQAECGSVKNFTHPEPHLRLQNLIKVGTDRVVPLVNGFDEINTQVCREFDAIRNSIPGIFLPGDLLSESGNRQIQIALAESLDQVKAMQEALQAYQFSEKESR